jgi:ATP synthase protein I
MSDSADRWGVRNWPDSDNDVPLEKLTRDEAQALRERHPPLSPWRVVAAQAAAGVLCAALAGALSGSGGVAGSALWGALATVIPQALMARGMTKRRSSAADAAAGFMWWEMVKIFVALAMLAAAPKLVPNLNWPALLLTMFVGMLVNWFALRFQGKARDATNG